MLSDLDYGIIIFFFASLVIVALYFSKRASGSVKDYFLGGNKIPWYILGVSGVAAYIDMSGTLLQTSFYYMFGMKGFLFTFRGAIALIISFYMVYVAKWLNRSKVMTNAEWMTFRFGRGKQGDLSQLLSAIAAIVMVFAFMSYFFIGAGKFISGYVPLSENMCAILFFAIVLLFILAAGFYGVVFTDLFQSLLIFIIIIFLTIKAMQIGTPEYYEKFASQEWMSMKPTWKLDVPAGYETMKNFGLLLIFWIFSQTVMGFGQPHDAWSAQKFYAAKNEKESSMVAWQWVVMYSIRFAFMMAIGILAISLVDQITDPEKALNAVIKTYIPGGLKGVLIAGMIAAGVSSLASIVNSSTAYFVQDIYQKYLNPRAGKKHLVYISYLSTGLIMVVGIVIGYFIPNITSIWGWILMGLFTGMLPPNIIKWYWWRFNGLGYAFGMLFGIIGALLFQAFFGFAEEYFAFLFVLPISAVGSVIGTFIGKPTENETLVKFYKQVRPYGLWNPIRKQVDPQLVKKVKKEGTRDMLLIAPALIWQVSIYYMMTVMVAKRWLEFFVSLAIVALTSFILYKYWYKNLKSKSA